jgi:hypothetical protein
MQKILFYLARALTLAIMIYIIFFISNSPPPGFAGPYTTAHWLLILIVVGISIAAWKLPMMGGVLFLIFGFRFFIMIARPGNTTPGLLILGVFMLTAVLFIWEGLRNQQGTAG